MLKFELHHTDANCKARLGTIVTQRGRVETPTFMPVGTLGTVKGLEIEQVKSTGAQIILGNTYHLTLRPGESVVADLGGLHEFTGWPGLILTDSGGFQIFSLAQRTKISEDGAVFQAHTDGRRLEMTPESSLEIQRTLGSDIAMVLDHVVALPNEKEVIKEASDRTIRWAQRSRDHADSWGEADVPSVFAIVQGGLDPSIREECARALVELDFPGYAVGGLSVGEPPPEMYAMLDVTCPFLPADRPRYLMGVGRPQDLLESIRRGIDMFDCVMPTRNGRNALAFTDEGQLRLRNKIHQTDQRPLDANCPCPACQRSRGYLRHLFMAGEMLGPILLSIHNLTYYQTLMRQSREAIAENRFEAYVKEKMDGWAKAKKT